MKALKRTIIGLLVVVSVTLVWLHYQTANEKWVYHVRADFVDMPADDSALYQWLVAQPGVTNVMITREGQTLRVDYVSPNPPAKALGSVSMEANRRFGYRGRS